MMKNGVAYSDVAMIIFHINKWLTGCRYIFYIALGIRNKALTVLWIGDINAVDAIFCTENKITVYQGKIER